MAVRVIEPTSVLIKWINEWHQSIMIKADFMCDAIYILTKYELIKSHDTICGVVQEKGVTTFIVKRNVGRPTITRNKEVSDGKEDKEKAK